jgi:hypothetical protein
VVDWDLLAVGTPGATGEEPSPWTAPLSTTRESAELSKACGKSCCTERRTLPIELLYVAVCFLGVR